MIYYSALHDEIFELNAGLAHWDSWLMDSKGRDRLDAYDIEMGLRDGWLIYIGEL